MDYNLAPACCLISIINHTLLSTIKAVISFYQLHVSEDWLYTCSLQLLEKV